MPAFQPQVYGLAIRAPVAYIQVPAKRCKMKALIDLYARRYADRAMLCKTNENIEEGRKWLFIAKCFIPYRGDEIDVLDKV